MNITTNWYASAIRGLVDGSSTWNWITDPIYVALLTDGHVPRLKTHSVFADIAHEIKPSGSYVKGGLLLQGRIVTHDDADDETRLDADDAVWHGGITARFATVYAHLGEPAESPLIGCVSFGGNYQASGGEFKVRWHPSGVLQVKV